jgi:hypothetical protein
MSKSSAVSLLGFKNKIPLFRDQASNSRYLSDSSLHEHPPDSWSRRAQPGFLIQQRLELTSFSFVIAEPSIRKAGSAGQNDSGSICRNDHRLFGTGSEQQRQNLKSRSGQWFSSNQNRSDVFGFWNAQCLLSDRIERIVEVHMSSVSGITGYDGMSQIQDQKTKGAGTKDLGEDQFLSLLVTQLKNQDPLQPMENTEFVTQLATFSSLEKLTSIESILKKSLGLLSEAPAEQENSKSVGG